MTEEVKTETPKDGENTEPQLSDIEQRAIDMGWRPREEFEGSEDDFIEAKEFVRRKPLFDKIESQSKEIKNVYKAIDALKHHYTKREEAAVKRAIDQLKEARQEAIENSDGKSFELIDNQIKQAEQEADELKRLQHEAAVQPELAPEFVSWTEKNSWYVSSKEMRDWADSYGLYLHKQNMSPAEVLKRVSTQVRQEFPDKFRNPKKDNAPDVETSQRSTGASKRDTVVLSENERKVMNTLVSTGVFTKEEYLAQIKAMRDAK